MTARSRPPPGPWAGDALGPSRRAAGFLHRPAVSAFNTMARRPRRRSSGHDRLCAGRHFLGIRSPTPSRAAGGLIDEGRRRSNSWSAQYSAAPSPAAPPPRRWRAEFAARSCTRDRDVHESKGTSRQEGVTASTWASEAGRLGALLLHPPGQGRLFSSYVLAKTPHLPDPALRSAQRGRLVGAGCGQPFPQIREPRARPGSRGHVNRLPSPRPRERPPPGGPHVR